MFNVGMTFIQLYVLLKTIKVNSFTRGEQFSLFCFFFLVFFFFWLNQIACAKSIVLNRREYLFSMLKKQLSPIQQFTKTVWLSHSINRPQSLNFVFGQTILLKKPDTFIFQLRLTIKPSQYPSKKSSQKRKNPRPEIENRFVPSSRKNYRIG